MPDRDGYIAGVPCWVDTNQPDPDAAAEFYGALFGWESENTMPPDAPGKYFMARIRGRDVAAISSQMEPETPTAGTRTSRSTARMTRWRRSRRRAARVVSEPFDVFDSGRMAVFADPQGATFCVWQPNQHLGSRVVNEHGTVNFNDLPPTDVEGAKAFYGAVFGWGLLDMGGEGGMWTLPGVRRPPGGAQPGHPRAHRRDGRARRLHRRRREPAAGATTAQAAWGVTFGGRRRRRDRREGGGARRHGRSWRRSTRRGCGRRVIRDPQGATFTANQFVPENKDIEPAGSRLEGS